MDNITNNQRTISGGQEVAKSYKRYYRNLEPLVGKPKNRAYTATVFSFLAVSLFGWYGIRPTLQTILFLRREIQDNIEINKQMEQKIVNLLEAQAAYQNAYPKLGLLYEAIPQNPDVLPLIFELKNLANQTNASISAVTVPTVPLVANSSTQTLHTKSNEDSSTNVSIVMTISGGYSEIKNFLDGILSMRRIINIETLSITRNQYSRGDNAIEELRLMIRTHAYYDPET